ncbi:helix-turn-helix domain-containing protein [Solwaraspora sp. WMMD1047]|uniref:helix-turn-helix domain-containing protein n=1 Tax=Solwaraspora sp. WMMD1047 TaxID=3016102 RepID=UPI00241613FF|nr:helix-turn-helix domain-containing protein [Solwaraspora sp. WMMD1047]MDG4830783.1 helix-turn-helix domain-containing protein [Solwaraspora sp. WMMD1047]
MSLENDPERRVVSDPLALRALAHPLRLKLCGLVGREGSLTAAQAARQLGISQALASHHLRQLAKYGFVEPADAGDNRERPWRITAASHQFEAADGSSESWEPVELLNRYLVEQAAAQLEDWQQRRADEDPRWAEHVGVSQSLLYLTIEEFVEVKRRWDELVAPLAHQRPLGDPSQRPVDAVPVNLTLVAAPLRPTPSGG